MSFDTLFAMWRMVIDHFGIEACDKGDTLYWCWGAALPPGLVDW